MARRNYDPKFAGNTATANQMKPLPQFQQKKDNAVNQTKFVESLDDMLRRNKGGFTAIGSDVSSNLPWYIGNRAPNANPTGIQQNSTQASPFTPNAPSTARAKLPALPNTPNTDGLSSANDFLEAFSKAYNSVNPTPGTDISSPGGAMATGIQSTPDGGTLFSDGIIYYDDGSFRKGESDAYAIASDQSGGIKYSDGSIKMTYEQAGVPPQMSMPGGLGGLISGIFGQDRKITQEYGNYNPSLEPGSGYNYGTDIRTRDLTGDQRGYKLPIGVEVVAIFQDDGTRWGSRSGHQGYGNSILVKLPSGEMLRFSHMDSMGDFQVGQKIEAGQVFGTAGATGNTAGEHLDLEFYNTDGQLSNPSTFSGFTDVQTLAQVNPKLFSSEDDPQKTIPNMSQETNQLVAPNQASPTPMTDTVNNVVENVAQVPQQVGNLFADAVDKVNPTGDVDLGITELARGDREAAGEAINTTGTNLGLPALGIGEAVAGDLPAAGRELSQTIEQANPTPGIDLGISELFRGDLEGAKTNFQDTTSRVASRLQEIPEQIGNAIVPPAYASEADGGQKTPLQSLGQNIQGAAESVGDYAGEKVSQAKNLFTNAVEKPMEGVKRLKDEFTDFTDKINPFNFDPSQLSGDRKLGDEGGFSTNQLPGALSSESGEKNDIRDPFFKYGGAEKFKEFMNPEQAKSGALSTGLFNTDFYRDAGRIGEVFGATDFVGEATDKFKNLIRGDYGQDFENETRSKYSTERRPGETSYDSNSVSDYIKNIRSSVESYLGGLKPFTTENKTYSEYRPNQTNAVRPGQNYSPNVSTAQQLAQTRERENDQRGTIIGSALKNTVSSVKNLFSNISKPKAMEQPKVSVPQMSFAVEKPKASHKPSLEEYLSIGKTPEQFYAEVGGQATADAAGGAGNAAEAYFDAKADAYRQQQKSTNSSQSPSSVQNQAVDDAIKAAGEGKAYYSNTGNRIYNYTPANANMTDAGTGLPVYGGSSGYSSSSSSSSSNPGIFSQAVGAIKRLFNF